MKTWKAAVLGAIAAATAPVTLPVAVAILRPLVKAGTKAALVGYERARVRLAFASEELEDLIAEARAEAEEALAGRRANATAETAETAEKRAASPERSTSNGGSVAEKPS